MLPGVKGVPPVGLGSTNPFPSLKQSRFVTVTLGVNLAG